MQEGFLAACICAFQEIATKSLAIAAESVLGCFTEVVPAWEVEPPCCDVSGDEHLQKK